MPINRNPICNQCPALVTLHVSEHGVKTEMQVTLRNMPGLRYTFFDMCTKTPSRDFDAHNRKKSISSEWGSSHLHHTGDDHDQAEQSRIPLITLIDPRDFHALLRVNALAARASSPTNCPEVFIVITDTKAKNPYHANGSHRPNLSTKTTGNHSEFIPDAMKGWKIL